MSDQTKIKTCDKLFIYAGEMGGRFLFDKRLNENEEEYNHFKYLGTLNEVMDKHPSSLRKQVREAYEDNSGKV